MIAALALALATAAAPLDTAVFAGGCFWTVEALFEHVQGVTSAVSGFADGDGRAPRAEAVRVVYDPARVSYARLLDVFFAVAHDPTSRDRQGPDAGAEYRAVVFARTAAQRAAAQAYVARVTRERAPKPIATTVATLADFREAPPEHQDFARRHPTFAYVVVNDRPKLARLKATFPALWREENVARQESKSRQD